MGKVILCAGKKATNPYSLKTSGINIYTIEELCYCLHEQLDMLDESIIDRDMALFIKDELGFPERGELLERLVLTKADLKSRLVVIFCTADYFDEQEITSICSEIDELAVMSSAGRRKRRADRYIQAGCYRDAQREYKAILASDECGQLSDEEYGNILHNLGVISVRNGLCDSAADMFREAYERNGSQESLKSYFYALKLAKREQEYLSEAMRILDNGDLMEKLERELNDMNERAERSGEFEQVDRLKVLYQQGRTSEFDRLADEMIANLKRSYRNTNEE